MRVTITDLDHDSWAVEQGVAEAEGVEFHFLGGGKDAGLDPRVKGSEGLVVQYAEITADVMDFLLPELKVVGRYGVGVDTIDLDAAEARGIVVVNVPDYGTQSVADQAIALAVSVARNLPVLDRQARASKLDLAAAAPIHQFVDQTFGVLSFGRIGRACAEKARGLGFRTQVTDIIFPEGTTEVDGFKVASHDELLATSDIISVHVPLTTSTRHIFDDDAFAKMKPGAILVNTARGGLIDDAALAAALKAGTLRCAALDSFNSEPLTTPHIWQAIDNVILSPHVGGVSDASYVKMGTAAAANILQVLQELAQTETTY